MIKAINKINIVTLGCAKNTVDSELLLHQIKLNGITVEHDSPKMDAEIVIINTCGFINDAKKESVNTILQYVKAKNEGKIKKLYVIGCLSEKYKDILEIEIPEVDKYYGINYIDDIISTLKLNYYKNKIFQREVTTPGHFAYLKVSEGCNRKCSFCSIPSIRGEYISKTMEQVIREAEYLANIGVKELILIAQDLTYYGIDIYNKPSISHLINQISEIKTIEWIRLHYAYPANFPEDLLFTIKENPKVCKYIDIPFQHISDNILKKMHRGINSTQTQKLIDLIRKEIPDIAIRTTLLTGHPGETIEDFKLLKDFIIKNRFDKLGVFVYSHEDNTISYNKYKDDISEKTKNARRNELMNIQKEISYNLNKEKINRTFKVIIDRIEEDISIGRTEYDSPEVDNEVIFKTNNLCTGNFYNAKIIDAGEYDLFAEVQ